MCEGLSTFCKGRLKNNGWTGLWGPWLEVIESPLLPHACLSLLTARGGGAEVDMIMWFYWSRCSICLYQCVTGRPGQLWLPNLGSFPSHLVRMAPSNVRFFLIVFVKFVYVFVNLLGAWWASQRSHVLCMKAKVGASLGVVSAEIHKAKSVDTMTTWHSCTGQLLHVLFPFCFGALECSNVLGAHGQSNMNICVFAHTCMCHCLTLLYIFENPRFTSRLSL